VRRAASASWAHDCWPRAHTPCYAARVQPPNGTGTPAGNDAPGTGTAPGTGPEPPPPTGPLTVSEAAALLGITPRAVRKRLAAGELRGQLVDGAWLVWIPVDVEPRPDPAGDRADRGQGAGSAVPRCAEPEPQAEPAPPPEPGGEPGQLHAANSSAQPQAEPPPVPPTLPPQLAAVMEQWLAPLIAQIGDLREQLGREKLLREQAETRAAELAAIAARSAPYEAGSPPARHQGNTGRGRRWGLLAWVLRRRHPD
jgi:hypothetical protein